MGIKQSRAPRVRHQRILFRLALARGDAAAVAKHLQGPLPLDEELRAALAHFIDPPKRAYFRNQKADMKHQMLAVHVEHLRASKFPKLDSAIAEVMRERGVSERTIRTALRKYGANVRALLDCSEKDGLLQTK